MSNPMVTIIVPTFNRARYLPECLESLLAQTLPANEIIVVNDGSTDDTASAVNPYLDRIEYIEKENGGKSSALNLVMPGIQSDYVWIFDDDDVALPNALETHVAALEANPDAGFTYSTYYEGQTGPDGQIRKGAIHTLVDPYQDALFPQLLDGCFVAHPAIVVRSSCYRNVSPFDGRLIRSQDYDMLLRLSRRFKSIRIEKPTFICRAHSSMRGSVSNTFPAEHQGIQWYKYDKIIFRKLYDELALCEYLPGGRENESLGETKRRTALVQRMSIMARKGLWHLATRDLDLLAHEESLAGPLSRCEGLICLKAMENRLAVREMLSEESFIAAIRQLRKKGQVVQMRHEFARGLYYHAIREARTGNLRLAAAIMMGLVRILGFVGVVKVISFKLNRPFQVA